MQKNNKYNFSNYSNFRGGNGGDENDSSGGFGGLDQNHIIYWRKLKIIKKIYFFIINEFYFTPKKHFNIVSFNSFIKLLTF